MKIPRRNSSSTRPLGRRLRPHEALAVTVLVIAVGAGIALAATPAANTVPNFVPVTANKSRSVLVDGSHLYWTNTFGHSIGRSNLDGSGANQTFIDVGVGDPSGLATDGTFLYWTNPLGEGSGASTIGRASIDGSGVNAAFITGASKPIGLAVAAGKLYWSNYNGNSIGRANTDGTGVNQNFITGATGPYGIDVDSTFIYWANYGADVGVNIGRAKLDGSSVNQSFITGAVGATGIAVDGAYIYWANYLSATVGRAKLDGTGVNQSYVSAAVDPVGLDVDAVHLYWTSYVPQTVARTTFDTTPPELIVPLSVSVVATAVSGTPVVYPTAISASDPDDAAATLSVTCSAGTLLGGTFPTGVTTVSCVARDTQDNAVTRAFTVTVSLPAAPVLSISGDIAALAVSPDGATVAYPAPTSSSGTPQCLPASGSLFKIGTATVSCSATDGLGQTTTGSFKVVVSMPGFATLDVPADQNIIATSPAGATVTYPAATSDGGVPSCAPASGSIFALGSSVVTCTVTDSFGRLSTGSFTIKVTLPAPPVITVPANQVTTAGTLQGIVVSYPTPTASAGTATCLPASGTLFPVGVTGVSCTAVDSFGQVGTAAFSVTVLPPVAPPAFAVGPIVSPISAEAPVAAATTTAAATTVPPTTVVATTSTTVVISSTAAPTTVAAPATTRPAVVAGITIERAVPILEVGPATPTEGQPTFAG